MTANTTDLDGRTLGFRAVHAALRRDSRRLVRAAAHARTRADVMTMRDWFDCFSEMVEHHHVTEDRVWWPVLRESAPGFDRHVASLLDEHALLETAIEDVRHHLRNATDRVAGVPIHRLADVIESHLVAEERVVFEALAVAPEESVRRAERASGKGDTLAFVRYALPWVLDGADANLRDEVTRTVPAVMRILVGRWSRRYERSVAPVLAIAR